MLQDTDTEAPAVTEDGETEGLINTRSMVAAITVIATLDTLFNSLVSMTAVL